MARNLDGRAMLKKLSISAANATQEFEFNTTGNSRQNMGWMEMALVFTAVDTLTTLTFTSLGSGAFGAVIDNVRVETPSPTSVNDPADNVPGIFQLNQNYPNPFNPTTTIRYQLPKSAPVVLTIYNLLGREIRKLLDENQSVGEHAVQWDGRNSEGNEVASGLYVYRLNADSFHQTRKMLLLR